METAFVLLHTVPVLYEKHEDKVDPFAEKATIKIKKQYAVFDAKVLSKIPKGPLKGKLAQRVAKALSVAGRHPSRQWVLQVVIVLGPFLDLLGPPKVVCQCSQFPFGGQESELSCKFEV